MSLISNKLKKKLNIEGDNPTLYHMSFLIFSGVLKVEGIDLSEIKKEIKEDLN